MTVGEMFADGMVNEQELTAARFAASAVHFEAASPEIFSSAAHAAACAIYTVTAPTICTFAAANRAAACCSTEKESEQTEQAALFREIIGNPFRPVSVEPSWFAWHDGTVVKLAQAIYEERAFERLPILADALEEAGYHDSDILGHCRNVGPHVRGCWLVDLILGKR